MAVVVVLLSVFLSRLHGGWQQVQFIVFGPVYYVAYHILPSEAFQQRYWSHCSPCVSVFMADRLCRIPTLLSFEEPQDSRPPRF
jgi:hypothetical protein